ncbi:hypothetical protein [Amycolatopsis benzoatilytica]|uniref:hypothetical protein n=1 Tax=Amycolatopsis benzoatilytica TaxID=346045 RepID=UPI00036DC1DD|nr:hypothetical protein [Amycolatopsis benzoatilytica]
MRQTREPTRSARNAQALAGFFLLAYALSWSWTIPQALTHQVVQRGQGWPTHYPALLGPAIAAIAVTAWTTGRSGLRDLWSRITRWRVAPRWWLVGLSPLAFLALALAGLLATGQRPPPAISRSSAEPPPSAWSASRC